MHLPGQNGRRSTTWRGVLLVVGCDVLVDLVVGCGVVDLVVGCGVGVETRGPVPPATQFN